MGDDFTAALDVLERSGSLTGRASEPVAADRSMREVALDIVEGRLAFRRHHGRIEVAP